MLFLHFEILTFILEFIKSKLTPYCYLIFKHLSMISFVQHLPYDNPPATRHFHEAFCDVVQAQVLNMLTISITKHWHLHDSKRKYKSQIITNMSSDQPSSRVVRCWDTPCQGRERCWRRIGGQLFQSGPFQTFPPQALNKMSVFQQKCRKHGSYRRRI